MTAGVLKSRKLKDQSDRNVVETGTKTFLLNLESSQVVQRTLHVNMSGITLRTLFSSLMLEFGGGGLMNLESTS